MKAYLITLISILSFWSCSSQMATNNSATAFSLRKIVFHSSLCFGSCPRIDLEIDSDGNTILSRQFYKGKAQKVYNLSGDYKGTLKKEDYNTLTKLLISCKIDSLKFPDIQCCDGRVITLICYHNNKRIYLKSMLPPTEASDLISFLTKIGTDYSLRQVNSIDKIEE